MPLRSRILFSVNTDYRIAGNPLSAKHRQNTYLCIYLCIKKRDYKKAPQKVFSSFDFSGAFIRLVYIDLIEKFFCLTLNIVVLVVFLFFFVLFHFEIPRIYIVIEIADFFVIFDFLFFLLLFFLFGS